MKISCILGGCLTWGGVCQGVCLPRGVSAQGGVWPGVVSDLGGGGVCLSAWGVSDQGVSAGGCLPGGGVCLGGVCLGGVWTGGMSDQGGVSDLGGCYMWPIPSCIWCYLYAASSPTETHQQCSCLYSAGWSCDLQGILGYPRHPLWNRITHACENITLPELRWGR